MSLSNIPQSGQRSSTDSKNSQEKVFKPHCLVFLTKRGIEKKMSEEFVELKQRAACREANKQLSKATF